MVKNVKKRCVHAERWAGGGGGGGGGIDYVVV